MKLSKICGASTLPRFRASALTFLCASALATALATVLIAPAAVAQGQGSTTAPAAAPNRVGVLSVTAAVFNTAEGKQGLNEMQSKFTPQQTELQNLQKQIQDAQKRLQEGDATLPQEEKARLSRQIEIWTRTGTRLQQQLEEDVTYARNELGERILRKMDAVVDRYAKEGGFSLIIDVSSQQVPYWNPSVDVTQDIIKAYDAANPASGAAATQPGQTRPPAQPGQTRPRPPGK
ncbi:MAG: OmpH family outer membrane protein [Candidatus Acidiferrales bacterium]